MATLRTRPLLALVCLLVLASGCAGSPPGQTSAPSAAPTSAGATPASTPEPLVITAAPTTPGAADVHDHARPTDPITGSPVDPNPNCAYVPIDLAKFGGAAFANPPEIRSADGVLSTTLEVTYAPVRQLAGCPVHLRSYNGQPVGPTLRVKPGDTIRILLKNRLPANSLHQSSDMNTPHDFNTTNLHTHGLHVSPLGNSDNVLLAIQPGQEFLFEIKVPAGHPPGTFWYHPHSHGSVALQVTSGMEGMLIIEGGLDQVPEIAAAQERLLLLQQIAYDESGEIESYGQFAPCHWEPSKREQTINGLLYPTLTAAPGEVQRWRVTDSGQRESVTMELHGPAASDNPSITITDALKLPLVPLHEIAADGIALGRVTSWLSNTLEPGYRSDMLVQFQQPGTYYLVDGPSHEKALTCADDPENPNLLAKVQVSGAQKSMALPTSAQLASLAPFQPLVAIDPSQPPGADSFLKALVPVDGFQTVTLSVDSYPSNVEVNQRNINAMASDHEFDPNNPRRLTLGNTELWVLETAVTSGTLYFGHPFHIHVNPFQTWRYGPDGTPETLWRDTLMVRGGQKQYIYTQYRDYIGTFVYHCHILQHEDTGMMELLEIVTPPAPMPTPPPGR